MIEHCPHCEKGEEYPDGLRGLPVSCEACGERLTLPLDEKRADEVTA